MNLFSQLLHGLRFHRRRHRHLALSVAAFLLLTLFFVVFVLNSDSSQSLMINSSTSCRWLPSFMCGRKETSVQLDDLPFDPLKSVTSGDSGSKLTEADQAKMDFIMSSYKGKNAKRLGISHDFYERIMKVIVGAKPKCAKLDKYPNGISQSERVETDDEGHLKGNVFLEKFLSKFLELTNEDLQSMKESHRTAQENLPHKAPDSLYKGNGIVYVGGGKFNWLVLLSLRSLRAQDCKLPVEVFVPTLEEYELELCQRIFPVMNARCVHLPTALFGSKLKYASLFKFLGYQYKSLAILLLSFENVLFLDSDNIPLYAPDHFFTKEPFVSRGFIVWPDYWHRTTSPDYYRIAGVEVSRTKLLPIYDEHVGAYVEQNPTGEIDWEKFPLHERFGAIPDPASESGQLMISKKTHLNALLLALYYNLYGPDYYYPLFSQGAQGEGDKETFLAATVVTHKLYYQVGKFLTSFGNIRNKVFKGKGMGQYDAVEDYELNQQRQKLRKTLSGQEYKDAASKLQTPRLIFVHANYPKLDPWKLKSDQETVDKDGQRYRLYGVVMRKYTGQDFEQNQWNNMDLLLCDLKIKVGVFDKVDRNELCKEIQSHRDWLVSTEKTLD